MKVRADWLRELHVLLLLAVGLSVAVGLASGIATLTGQPFDVGVASGDVLRADALTGARPGVAVDPDASVYLRVEHPTVAQSALATMATLPGYALTTTMLVLLWRLVARARHDDPFTAGTVRRLRVLGWLLVVGGPVSAMVELAGRFALAGTVKTGGPDASLDLGSTAVWFLAGFGMLAIAEVVRRGQALRAELDGVV
ncbi:DUF2975 domain-containing protein [Dactylosporangium sp. NPDC005572]|uniref:DUF2975 domain-containing protein n=1 Tax=Dactylosporangium sp. NPDC005572 TaxID=3156889 RepID=UPI0033BA343C